MGEFLNYPLDIILRTRNLLISDCPAFKDRGTEVTFLICTSLTLFTSIKEMHRRKGVERKITGLIDDAFLSCIPSNIKFWKKPDAPNGFDGENRAVSLVFQGKEALKKCTKEWIVTKIRNGLAHQNILPVNQYGYCVGLKIWNEPIEGFRDFQIEFTTEELREFVTMVSGYYS